jgi:hypothetical protein
MEASTEPMSSADDIAHRAALERLRSDAAECGTAVAASDAVAASLRMPAGPVPEIAALSQRVLRAAAPLLAAHAKRAYRRQLARDLLLSLSPLPVVVFFNMYLLREAHALLSSWLPDGIIAWLVVGYGSMLLLLCALTYAALPLLIARARALPAATS